MREFRYTLLSDGPTDQALLPILEWSLRQNGLEISLLPQWADPQRFPKKSHKLQDRIPWAIELYPCDLFFVHRDAEKESFEFRKNEIEQRLSIYNIFCPSICVIPVRMTEAWLLFNEQAIRRASGNPNGKMPLNLPSSHKIEKIPDPKEILHEKLRIASNLSGRRLDRFNERYAASLVANYIEDYNPLIGIPAFDKLHKNIADILMLHGWIGR